MAYRRRGFRRRVGRLIRRIKGRFRGRYKRTRRGRLLRGTSGISM